MINLKQLLKEYNCEIHLKKAETSLKLQGTKPVSDKSHIYNIIWPVEFLPYTKYLKNSNEIYLDKVEKWILEPLNFKNKEWVEILTSIDMDLISNITADDLISYDGHFTTNPILHLQNKNKTLISLFSTEFETKRLFKLMKHALIYKNYNLIHLLVKASQNKKINEKKAKKIDFYKNILDNQEGGIFPLNWLLKDCEDSNLNIESEVASIRFCKVIERLKEMKKLEFNFKVKEKNKQKIYSKLWEIASRSTEGNEELKNNNDLLYLIL